MGEQLVPYSAMNNAILDNATRFMNFLSSDTVRPIRASISIIPNFVRDVLDVALEGKRLHDESRRKTKLGKEYLSLQDAISKREFQLRENESIRRAELQDRENQRRYALEIERIRASADVQMAEIDFRREATLSRIDAEKRTRMREIEAHEYIEVERIRAQYALQRQKLDNEQRRFLYALRASNRHFHARMKDSRRVQAELTCLIDAIAKKVNANRATKYECELLERLTWMKIQSLEKSFDLSEELVNWWGGVT